MIYSFVDEDDYHGSRDTRVRRANCETLEQDFVCRPGEQNLELGLDQRRMIGVKKFYT